MKIDQLVHFPDPNLSKVMEERLGKRPGNITVSILENMTELDASFKGIADLTGLEGAVNLTKLDLKWNRVGDLTPLSHLKKLEQLDLSSNDIKDISTLQSLNKLKTLRLSYNSIADLVPLGELDNLKALDLEKNRISNIDPLKYLFRLSILKLSKNRIENIAVLRELPGLKNVALEKNKIDPERELASLYNCQPALIAAVVKQVSLFKELSQLEQRAVVGYMHNPTERGALALLDRTSVTAEIVQKSLSLSQLERRLSEKLAYSQIEPKYVVEFLEKSPFSPGKDKVSFLEEWGSPVAREILVQIKERFLNELKKSPRIVDSFPHLTEHLKGEIEQVLVEQLRNQDVTGEYIKEFMASKKMPLDKMNLIYQYGSKEAKIIAMDYQLAL